MISGGGGAGQDVCHSYIVKLVGPDDYNIEEVIAWDHEYKKSSKIVAQTVYSLSFCCYIYSIKIKQI